ncbi:hypothetical protein KTT_27480 [Tengunoibacter tsumagoiensis]|uniref:Uncharacterized protein n=1 Tax=Tengunoibacter tsumagoiensis TaxID=2014871 RepID=A0A402A1G7_9CHLR|nr:hypothetical protein KTT_27480 [Tengunoibacter tsumagoiensis]
MDAYNTTPSYKKYKKARASLSAIKKEHMVDMLICHAEAFVSTTPYHKTVVVHTNPRRLGYESEVLST